MHGSNDMYMYMYYHPQINAYVHVLQECDELYIVAMRKYVQCKYYVHVDIQARPITMYI